VEKSTCHDDKQPYHKITVVINRDFNKRVEKDFTLCAGCRRDFHAVENDNCGNHYNHLGETLPISEKYGMSYADNRSNQSYQMRG
jgi:hypothetical protein